MSHSEAPKKDNPDPRIAARRQTFYQVLANSFVMIIVNMTVWFALIFYIFLQTKSVFATAMMSGIYTLVTAATGIWFGSIVDHNKKKRVILASNVISLAFFLVSFAIYLFAPEGTFTNIQNITIWVFIPLVLLGVLAGNLRGIALPTLVKILIPEEERAQANGLLGTVTGSGFLIVSVISALLVGHSGMQLVFVLSIVLSVVAILHMAFLTIPEHGIAHIEGHTDAPKKIDLKGTIALIRGIPGLLPLIFFTTINNFLGGVFMSLMDAYGLSIVSVQTWGILWGFISTAFIAGGIVIAKFGLRKNPVATLINANLLIWGVSAVFTVYPSIWPLVVGCFVYLATFPFIEASEQTIIQKVVPQERLGRVFGFAQSVEQSASPITAFVVGPLAQFVVIPFMTTGGGVELLGPWWGTGMARSIALIFTIAGVLGLIMTWIARNSPFYTELSKRYQEG
jgi:DHA3 family multidrug efflux protein-like MFS transporter